MFRALLFVLVSFAALCGAPSDPGHVQAPGQSQIAGRTFGGNNLDCDLPGGLHIRNIGSKVDGAGMCVMSSIEMAALYCGREEYRGLRDWCANERGGGTPKKVDAQLAAFCEAKKLPKPQYLQYEGPDCGKLVEAVIASGRMACITYGYSPRYKPLSSINHMVCAVKLSGGAGVVLDNNFPGEDAYEWMESAELVRRISYPRRDGWVFVWLFAPPPPSPKN